MWSDLLEIFEFSGFGNVTPGHVIMIVVALFFMYLGIFKRYEPLLLVPIGFGIIVGNIPFEPGMQLGIYETGSILNYLYFGVTTGVYPSLIFLGIGAMLDFSALLSNPKLLLLGAAAQMGIFGTLIGALALGFTPMESGSVFSPAPSAVSMSNPPLHTRFHTGNMQNGVMSRYSALLSCTYSRPAS